MKLKNKIRLLNELARESENPKEFIQHCMSLQNQSVNDIVENIDMTAEHFYVALSNIANGGSIGIRVIVKISKGLDIDPNILNRLVADYNLKKHLNGVNQNN